MAQTTKTSNLNKNQELSIQVSLSGLSFCILHKGSNTITYIKYITFVNKVNPIELLDKLKHAFNSEEVLNDTFNGVNVIHVNDLSSLVPKPLFNEDYLADYLKFNSKILKSDFLSFDDIAINDSVNVYVPFVNLNNFIYDQYGSFTYKHFSTVLIENILTLEKNAVDTKVYAHIGKDHFEIVIVNKGELLIYNTFEYTTKEDFIYYLLFTSEQLQLNPETLHLVFLGDINKDSELYDVSFKYIRNVGFGNRYDSYNYVNQPKTNYSDFTLIKSF